MKTKICFHDLQSALPPVGYEFYMVDVTFENTGETRRDGHRNPQRTNMSGEERAEGWLGSTDNISLSAQGKYRVDRVISKTAPKYWMQGIAVEVTEI